MTKLKERPKNIFLMNIDVIPFIVYIFINILLYIGLEIMGKIKKIDIDWEFHLLVPLIILALLLINKAVFDAKTSQFIITCLLILLSFVSFLVSTGLITIMNNIFKIDDNIAKIYYAFNNEFTDVYVNNTFITITLLLVLSYIIYSAFLKLIILFIEKMNHYKADNIIISFYKNTKIISVYLTIFLVVFGFLPLFIGFLEYEKNDLINPEEKLKIIDSFNSVIFGGFVTSIIPYSHLLLQEFKENKMKY